MSTWSLAQMLFTLLSEGPRVPGLPGLLPTGEEGLPGDRGGQKRQRTCLPEHQFLHRDQRGNICLHGVRVGGGGGEISILEALF